MSTNHYGIVQRLRYWVPARVIYGSIMALMRQYCLHWWAGAAALYRYFRDFAAYRQMTGQNENFVVSYGDLNPCLRDKTTITPIEPTYFFQNAWAASKLFALAPSEHHDVGSSIAWLGVIAQFVPTTTVDIRAPDVQMRGLTFRSGSILDLPFPDRSIASLSSLCVVEHIGLGRYGDPIDPWGSEKAIRELKRVLKPGGSLLISVPIDRVSRVYFNAHRAFARDYLLSLMEGLRLIEERYVYRQALFDAYEPAKGFGTGLYQFIAP